MIIYLITCLLDSGSNVGRGKQCSQQPHTRIMVVKKTRTMWAYPINRFLTVHLFRFPIFIRLTSWRPTKDTASLWAPFAGRPYRLCAKLHVTPLSRVHALHASFPNIKYYNSRSEHWFDHSFDESAVTYIQVPLQFKTFRILYQERYVPQ